MAWECCKVEEQRLRFIEEFVKGEASIVEICRKYHISRKTAYKWYQRFTLLGKEGLKIYQEYDMFLIQSIQIHKLI